MEAGARAFLAVAMLAALWGAPAAANGPTEIVIAILDTGIDHDHIEFAPGQLIGWKDDLTGSATPFDDHGHGTATASVAAGLTVGEAPGTKLLAAKVCNEGGSCFGNRMADAIEWAADEGAHVISLSIGGGVSPELLGTIKGSVNYAVDKGALVVFSAGNSPEPSTLKRFGHIETALIVSSATEAGNPLLSGHSTDPHVTQAGISVYAARPGDRYWHVSGTSFAAPNVAGIAAAAQAAWHAEHGTLLSPQELEDLLKYTARDAAAYPPTAEGYGFVTLDRVLDQVPLGMPLHPCFDDLADPLVANHCSSALYVDAYAETVRTVW